MANIKNNKITALWLLLTVIVVGFGQKTTQPELPLQNYIEEEMHLVGAYPKVGEIFEIVYRIEIKEAVDWTPRESYLTYDYCAIIHAPSEATEIIGESKFFFSGLKIGECKEFRTHCRILKPRNWIQVTGHIALVVKGEVRGPISSKGGIPFYLIDSETGQYGTKEEKAGKYKGIEYRYDAEVFDFIGPDPSVGQVNRKVIEMMRRMEPSLSDSEALLLHSDIMQVGIPQGIHLKKYEEGMLPGEDHDEVYKYYLRQGWLKAMREGKREEWIKRMIKINGGGKGINFFRPGTDSFGHLDSDSNKIQMVKIALSGFQRNLLIKSLYKHYLLNRINPKEVCNV